MKVQSMVVNINSPQPEKMMDFYENVVGLEREPNSGGLKAGGTSLFIVDGHSDVNGPTENPARVLVNFFVEAIEPEHARLEAAGVQCIRKLESEPWGGIFSTFVDPDGNYFQLVEFRPA
jgi:predicted enzyme related to lactoylglutathione lyase